MQKQYGLYSSWGSGGIAGSVINADVSGCDFSGVLESESDASGRMVGEVMAIDTGGQELEPE